MAPNHRLLAREHLAEATALADEGRVEDCRASLLAAAGHSIGQLAADHQLDAPSISRAMAVLTLRGVLPFDARPLWRSLSEQVGADRSNSHSTDAREAFAAVQALVDLAAGIRATPPATAAWQRWGALPADDEDDGEGEGQPLPVSGTGWVLAVARDRARRRGRRARRVIATTACAVGLAVVGFAWSNAVDGTEYQPAKADIGFFDSGS